MATQVRVSLLLYTVTLLQPYPISVALSSGASESYPISSFIVPYSEINNTSIAHNHINIILITAHLLSFTTQIHAPVTLRDVTTSMVEGDIVVHGAGWCEN